MIESVCHLLPGSLIALGQGQLDCIMLPGTRSLCRINTLHSIEFTKKSMGLTKEVAPSQVFDFSFAAKALGRGKN
ncbi:MAG: hypothetical protein ACXW6J_18800 [Candidatus Binatia bacterium]